MQFFKTVVLFFVIFFCSSTTYAQIILNYESLAQQAIANLKNNQFDSVYSQFSKNIQRQFNTEQLEGLWTSLTMSYGELKEIGSTKTTPNDSLTITKTELHFKKMPLNIKLVFNKLGLIDGFFFEPITADYASGSYVLNHKFYDIKLSLGEGIYKNEGVLSMPNTLKKVPLVIIVGGSGPTNLDGTIGPNKPYRDIAEGLASNQIAAFRYNKRTVGYAKEMLKLNSLTVKEEYLNDLKEIVKELKAFEGIDKSQIYLLCHSQAGYLMPYFNKNIRGIKGFIGLAPGFRNLAEVFVEQLTYISLVSEMENEKAVLKPLIIKANYAKNKLAKNSPPDSLIPGLSAHYLLDLNKKNPANTYKYLKNKPVLNLRGDADYQVTEKDIEGWDSVLGSSKNYQSKTYKNLNHVFITVNKEGKYCKPKDYKVAGNVNRQVLVDIIEWINKNN